MATSFLDLPIDLLLEALETPQDRQARLDQLPLLQKMQAELGEKPCRRLALASTCRRCRAVGSAPHWWRCLRLSVQSWHLNSVAWFLYARTAELAELALSVRVIEPSSYVSQRTTQPIVIGLLDSLAGGRKLS